jgi:NADP-dependent aldehyde dehydrogenase
MLAVARHLEGQLTATVHATADDRELAASLLPTLERKAGRVLFNGFPTGVEVSHAMVHGGPFPATSDSRTTSVGATAIDRFLRPVCYQDVPAELLPEALRDDNPLGLARMVDGTLQLAK